MLTIVLVCIAYFAYWLWEKRQTGPNEPPQLPGAVPFFGHALHHIGDSAKLWRTISNFAELSYNMGGVVTAKFGPRIVYMLTDPDDMLTVVNTCLEKDELYGFAKPWLGEGLVTAGATKWKVHRKILNPAFSQNVLDQFMGVFNSMSRKLVNILHVEVGKSPFDFGNYTRSIALETICLTAFGIDFTDASLNNKYLNALDFVLNSMVERFTKFWLHSPFIFSFSKLKKQQDANIKILHEMAEAVLQKRKSELESKTSEERSKVVGKRFISFMDVILDLSMDRGLLNDKEIRDHVNTLIVAGHDTSASVLVLVMKLLGAHPDVQEKLYAEIKEVLGEGYRDIEKQDLSKLVYLEAIIKETLRLYSIVPVYARKLTQDVKLKNYTLTAGRTCFMFVFGQNKHPIWGRDRLEFNPDRWFDPSKLPKNPNAYAPFAFGRRMCIGPVYAMMSIKTTVAHIIRRYRVKADKTPMLIKMDVMLRPADAHHISIEKRR